MGPTKSDDRAMGSLPELAQDLRALLGKRRHRLRKRDALEIFPSPKGRFCCAWSDTASSLTHTEAMRPQSVSTSPRWSLLGPAAGTSPETLSLRQSKHLYRATLYALVRLLRHDPSRGTSSSCGLPDCQAQDPLYRYPICLVRSVKHGSRLYSSSLPRLL